MTIQVLSKLCLLTMTAPWRCLLPAQLLQPLQPSLRDKQDSLMAAESTCGFLSLAKDRNASKNQAEFVGESS